MHVSRKRSFAHVVVARRRVQLWASICAPLAGTWTGCLASDEEIVTRVQSALLLRDDDMNAAAPSAAGVAFDDIVAACPASNELPATPPDAPQVPTLAAPLPDACDVEARIDDVIGACGARVAAVDVGSLAERVASCAPGTTCSITLPAGTFDGELTLGCVILQGAGDDTRIRGTLSFSAPSVLSRVAVDADYGAVSATADLLVDRCTLRGGYEGVGVSWDQEIDVAVCGSRVSAGYAGVEMSWASRRLTVAGSSIAACYEGVGASWGSSQLHVSQNIVVARDVGVEIHHGHDVAVLGNVLWGDALAVEIFSGQDTGEPYTRPSSNILVRGNDVRRGALPASDPAAAILIDP